jgi:hypothetical protein
LFSYGDLESRVRGIIRCGRSARLSKNRDRLLPGDCGAQVSAAALAHPTVERLLSTAHFSVDGTL